MRPKWKVTVRARDEEPEGEVVEIHHLYHQAIEVDEKNRLLQEAREVFIERYGRPPIYCGVGMLPYAQKLDESE